MPNPLFSFLKRLSAHNTREWVAEHKAEYEQAKQLRDEIASRFIAAVASVDPAARDFPIEKCVYRLVRDTRFSSDKTPYKTHIGIFVCPPLGKKAMMAGYYLHLEPGNSMLWGGVYGLPTNYLTVIRRDIRDNIEEYISIVESPEFKEYFPSVGDDPLKTAPKGFSNDWEYIDYVRPREFGATLKLDDSFFDNAGFTEVLIPALVQLKRLNDFLNFTLTESGLPLLRPTRR
ncbi:MAG: DUF2461 domain-containing protein [Duncaniella sp.]|nr:DUF2461 domain-containing protein [Duncaniella sp.]